MQSRDIVPAHRPGAAFWHGGSVRTSSIGIRGGFRRQANKRIQQMRQALD